MSLLISYRPGLGRTPIRYIPRTANIELSRKPSYLSYSQADISYMKRHIEDSIINNTNSEIEQLLDLYAYEMIFEKVAEMFAQIDREGDCAMEETADGQQLYQNELRELIKNLNFVNTKHEHLESFLSINCESENSAENSPKIFFDATGCKGSVVPTNKSQYRFVRSKSRRREILKNDLCGLKRSSYPVPIQC